MPCVSVLVSRCDRLGDLILSLPAMGLLRDAGLKDLWLHTSAYARTVGEWARHNGIIQGVWAEGERVPEALVGKTPAALSLFHCPEAIRAFREAAVLRSYGPRSKLSALWNYHRSLNQRRSQVRMSEAAYNVELARFFLRKEKLETPEFRGLPKLELPLAWVSPHEAADLLIVASNGGSAHNWPLRRYLESAGAAISEGKSVQFLIHGTDAESRMAEFRASPVAARALLLPSFEKLEALIAHISSCGETLSSSTGPLHIAHAAGRPVTGLFPETPLVQSFKRWRPDGYWHEAPVRWIHV